MDTVTSRLLSSTNFWSMWKMGPRAGMWSKMTHKSSFISSVVLAEKDELLFFHLIHMSICLLFVPLSKDYWCPAFDIWHISQCSFSSSELTQKKCKPDCHRLPGSLTFLLCSRKPPTFLILSRRGREHYGYPSLVANCLSDLCTSLHFIIYCVSSLCHPHNKLNLSVLDWISFSFPPQRWDAKRAVPEKQAQHSADGYVNNTCSLVTWKIAFLYEFL